MQVLPKWAWSALGLVAANMLGNWWKCSDSKVLCQALWRAEALPSGHGRGYQRTTVDEAVLGFRRELVLSFHTVLPKEWGGVAVSIWGTSTALLVSCCMYSRRRCHKLFTFSSSSPESLGQFQPFLAQSILGWRAFKFVRMNVWNCENAMTNFKNLHLQNQWANFNQTWLKVSLSEGDSSLFKWRANSFQRGDNYEIAKIHKSLGQFQPNLAQIILGSSFY